MSDRARRHRRPHSKRRDDAELAYLISLQLPPRGTVCNVDELPFGLAP
jgi:hypothetical protein